MLSTNSLFETGRHYYLKPAAGILRAFETITILRMGIHESLFRFMVETILFSLQLNIIATTLLLPN
jgi:hypothetical protein